MEEKMETINEKQLADIFTVAPETIRRLRKQGLLEGFYTKITYYKVERVTYNSDVVEHVRKLLRRN
jgi:DeoR/GlpR family transcriptional regulator of sugar metabolism